MTTAVARRFGEFIAEDNEHFDNWCRENNYAHTNLYGAFEMKPWNARKAIAEYRKTFGFTDGEYRAWNKYKGWHWGYIYADTKI